MYMNNNFELGNSSKKTLFIFALLLGLIVFLSLFYLSNNKEETTKKNILNEERHSRIINIFRVKEEHNYIYIKFSGGEVSNFKYSYKIGDSISKNKGDSIEYIFRGDSIIRNNLFEVNW
ncbi:hypothetical protein BOQ64_12410 [Chryseobacterium sp. CH25]|nr:hypothetical protein BOQ64_12410 [Chryseobacterium sp. CH25]RXM67289.1 hypothetical protein BOQ60_05135 [Chryseobacterium sp. CH1]